MFTSLLLTATLLLQQGFLQPTPISKTGLSNTVVVVSALASKEVTSYMCSNEDATHWAYVQMFNVSGSVTVGTTVADFIIQLPPASAANLAIEIYFSSAIKIAATTTATGSTSATTAVNCSFTIR